MAAWRKEWAHEPTPSSALILMAARPTTRSWPRTPSAPPWRRGPNLAIKCATYRWSNDGRKSCLLEPPITRKLRRYQVYEGLASDLSATHIPLMGRRLYGEVCRGPDSRSRAAEVTMLCTGVRGIGILRTSHSRSSEKFSLEMRSVAA